MELNLALYTSLTGFERHNLAVNPSSDGNFSSEFRVGGIKWKFIEAYCIKVSPDDYKTITSEGDAVELLRMQCCSNCCVNWQDQLDNMSVGFRDLKSALAYSGFRMSTFKPIELVEKEVRVNNKVYKTSCDPTSLSSYYPTISKADLWYFNLPPVYATEESTNAAVDILSNLGCHHYMKGKKKNKFLPLYFAAKISRKVRACLENCLNPTIVSSLEDSSMEIGQCYASEFFDSRPDGRPTSEVFRRFIEIVGGDRTKQKDNIFKFMDTVDKSEMRAFINDFEVMKKKRPNKTNCSSTTSLIEHATQPCRVSKSLTEEQLVLETVGKITYSWENCGKQDHAPFRNSSLDDFINEVRMKNPTCESDYKSLVTYQRMVTKDKTTHNCEVKNFDPDLPESIGAKRPENMKEQSSPQNMSFLFAQCDYFEISANFIRMFGQYLGYLHSKINHVEFISMKKAGMIKSNTPELVYLKQMGGCTTTTLDFGNHPPLYPVWWSSLFEVVTLAESGWGDVMYTLPNFPKSSTHDAQRMRYIDVFNEMRRLGDDYQIAFSCLTVGTKPMCGGMPVIWNQRKMIVKDESRLLKKYLELGRDGLEPIDVEDACSVARKVKEGLVRYKFSSSESEQIERNFCDELVFSTPNLRLPTKLFQGYSDKMGTAFSYELTHGEVFHCRFSIVCKSDISLR